MSQSPEDLINQLTPQQKGAVAYRILALAGITASTLIGTAVLGYVKAASSQLDLQGKDIALIKWEIPAIKQAQASDKSQIQNQILSLEDRIKETRIGIDKNQNEISSLRVEQALIKQRTP